ncbi:metal ABC transporter substrate-binding protein [Teredinibacter turnerae]|uniref:metal ABC transporter substrate-binding protein n=1 Tax=Teredinibacter turnerae TaxID=2426 RepID=UPI0030D4BAA8
MLFAAALFGLANTAGAESNSPAEPFSIVTSLPPLALAVQDLVNEAALADKVSVESIVPRGQSAHHHALKVSQLRSLKSAGVVVWVGPEMEQYLAKAIGQRRPENVVGFAALMQKPVVDYHLWLSADAMTKLVAAVAEKLALAFPEANVLIAASTYNARLRQQTQAMEQRFAALPTEAGVLVFHESLHHLLAPLGIKQSASLVQVPEQQISVHTLMQAKSRMLPGQCLLADVEELPQAQPYAEKLGAPLVVVDLLASAATTKSYEAFLALLANKLATCFQSATGQDGSGQDGSGQDGSGQDGTSQDGE